MGKQEISYKGLDKREADEKAIQDIKNYCEGYNPKLWKILLVESLKVKNGNDFQIINMSMGFAGIEGFPVHAFGRRYCLIGYRDWMHSTAGGSLEPIMTDEHGFRIDGKGN